MEPNAARQDLDWLLGHIPDSDILTAREFLCSLLDPVTLSLLTAPSDDEPQTDGERDSVEAARREAGSGTPHDEVLKEFGL